MRGAYIVQPGAAPVVEGIAEPQADGGEVLLSTIAGAVNDLDLVIAGGGLPPGPSPLPFVPGREGVGEVISTGVWHGKRVWFEARGGLGGHGSLAERALADEPTLVELPPQMDSVIAARYGIAGAAAWLALNWRARIRPGEHVAVLGPQHQYSRADQPGRASTGEGRGDPAAARGRGYRPGRGVRGDVSAGADRGRVRRAGERTPPQDRYRAVIPLRLRGGLPQGRPAAVPQAELAR